MEKKKCIAPGCGRIVYARGACSAHYQRMRATGSYKKSVRRGKNHWSWRGGKSQYPGHYILKKNRLVRLKQAGNKCEDCRAFANRVVRRDGSASNHAVENLKAVCRKCFGRNIRLRGKGKYKSKYGRVGDLAEKHGVSEAEMYRRLRRGLPPGGSGRRAGRPKKIRLTETPRGESRA